MTGVVIQPFYLEEASGKENLNVLNVWFDTKANAEEKERLTSMLRQLTVSVTNSTDAELIQLFNCAEDQQNRFCYHFLNTNRSCFIYNYNRPADFGKFLLAQSESIYGRSKKIIFWRSVTFSSFNTSHFAFSFLHSPPLFSHFSAPLLRYSTRIQWFVPFPSSFFPPSPFLFPFPCPFPDVFLGSRTIALLSPLPLFFPPSLGFSFLVFSVSLSLP